MSLSVNSSNPNNPYAFLQSLMQQGSSPTSSATQSDPLSELMAALDQQNNSSSASAAGASSSPSSTGAGSAPQFGPQMLQALFAMQADVSNALVSQLDGSTAGASQQGGASASGAGDQNPLDALFSASGTSQTTANANGSSTTTITYADGSSVAMTTPAGSSGSSTSADSSSAANGTNAVNNNLIEQLIQMQAQLLNTTTPQSIMTV